MGASIVVAYTWAAVVLVVFFLIAVFISNAISYRPGGGDVTQRKIVFWIFCVLTPAVTFGINAIIAHDINVPTARDSYLAQGAIAAGAAFVLFFLMGVVLSKAFSRSKISSWF